MAHGDFHLEHIYYDKCGYAGIIDFGDIRGAHPFYDLGYFFMEDSDLFQPLLKGYEEVSPLSIEAKNEIRLTGILIAVRRIGRRLMEEREPYSWDLDFAKGAIKEI